MRPSLDPQVLLENNHWSTFAWALPYEPHGPVHMYVGGEIECNGTFNAVLDYLEADVFDDDDGATTRGRRMLEHRATHRAARRRALGDTHDAAQQARRLLASGGHGHSHSHSHNHTRGGGSSSGGGGGGGGSSSSSSSRHNHTHSGNVTHSKADMPAISRAHFMYLLRTDMFISLKNLYRDGMFVMPSYCSSDTPFSECHGTCADLHMIQEGINNNDTSFVELYWTKMFSWDSEVGIASSFSSWLDTDIKARIIRMICERGVGVDGDQLESASPMDPSFWPIHPTMERLWMYKKISRTLYNETWPATSYSIWDSCYGHRAHDIIPFRFSLKTTGAADDLGRSDSESDGDAVAARALLTAENSTGGVTAVIAGTDEYERSYTNHELYELASPANSYMPYIYADFEWEHCHKEGYLFDDVLVSDDDTAADDD